MTKEKSRNPILPKNGCGEFSGLFGRVLTVFLPCPLKMLATETGETLGRKTFSTQPKSLKNPQQPVPRLLKQAGPERDHGGPWD